MRRSWSALTAARRLWIDAPGRAGWREQLERLAAWAEKNNGGTDYNAPVGATHEGSEGGGVVGDAANAATRRRERAATAQAGASGGAGRARR